VATAESTNYAKFRSGNPVVDRFIDRYFRVLGALVESLSPTSVLDAGCGEGETIARLSDRLPPRVVGVDLSEDSVSHARRRLPRAEISQGSVYDLKFAPRSFDLVLCLEVLEHLDQPARALGELCRVSGRDIVLSVPWEPWFRLGSLGRGRHVRGLGNHPEHVQRWTRRGFRDLLAPRLELVALSPAFPWLVAHCRAPRPGR
jgi:SAM-dependent methyltransferase